MLRASKIGLEEVANYAADKSALYPVWKAVVHGWGITPSPSAKPESRNAGVFKPLLLVRGTIALHVPHDGLTRVSGFFQTHADAVVQGVLVPSRHQAGLWQTADAGQLPHSQWVDRDALGPELCDLIQVSHYR